MRAHTSGRLHPLAPLLATICATAGVLGVATAAPAAAASLSDERAVLRVAYYAAGEHYRSSRELLTPLPRQQVVAAKEATAAGTAALREVGELIGAARTSSAMASAAAALAVESRRALTVLEVVRNLRELRRLRKAQQDVALTALTGWEKGWMPPVGYWSTRARTIAYSTLLARDTTAQLAALGEPVPAPRLGAPPWTSHLRADLGTIPTAAGWIGFPGGCALPRASPAYLPRLPESGPGVATSADLVAATRQRALTMESFGAQHRQLLRAAEAEAALIRDSKTPETWFPTRATRLGYGWLNGEDTSARDVLRSDTRRLIRAGPADMNSLHASHVLLAAAGAANWTGLRDLDETALVRWLGPQTCLQADRENFVDGPTNIAAIHNTASFVAAAVFLRNSPAQAAALAQESLLSVRPALEVITQDGGSSEGPSYWSYQSRAVATLYSTLQNAYRREPVTLPSPTRTADYALNSTGADGLPTPFGDSYAEPLSPLLPAWIAHVTKDRAVAAWVQERAAAKPDAYLLWWWTEAGKRPAPESALYARTGLAVLQGVHSTATLKGGSNATNHAHLDLGSISLHRRDVQWAVDPGLGNYDSPGYFSAGQRWTYWKTSTAAHSTLSLTGQNQPVTATAGFNAATDTAATVDLRAALPGTSTAARTVRHTSSSTTVRDQLRSPTPLALTWRWVTDASVSVGHHTAVLRRDGQVLSIRLSGVPVGSSLTADAAPGTGPRGQPLTVLTLSMPPVGTLDLTATAT